MHEVMTRTSKGAKEEALYIVGRVIFSDPDLLKICSNYAGDNHATEPFGEESEESEVTRVESLQAGESTSSKTCHEPGIADEVAVVDAPIAIEFLLEITSSVSMLPPLDQDVSCKHVMEVIGAGMKPGDDGQMELVGGDIVLGKDAPEKIVLAMGKYCASRRDVAQMYPTVSAFTFSAWEKNKERLALDNFFRSMGGKNWISNHGWMEKGGELRHRYGVAVEDEHVTKLCLATNNLQGEHMPLTLEEAPTEVHGLVNLPRGVMFEAAMKTMQKRTTEDFISPNLNYNALRSLLAYFTCPETPVTCSSSAV